MKKQKSKKIKIIPIAPIMDKLKKISLKEAEKKGYKKLGEAFGIHLAHCIQEGLIHCKDFGKRAKYYVVKLDIKSNKKDAKLITNTPTMMVVAFYE